MILAIKHGSKIMNDEDRIRLFKALIALEKNGDLTIHYPSNVRAGLQNLILEMRREGEVAFARKVLGVSSMVNKRKGVTQSMRLKLITEKCMETIPDSLGIPEHLDVDQAEQ